jgi:hypothetical protein
MRAISAPKRNVRDNRDIEAVQGESVRGVATRPATSANPTTFALAAGGPHVDATK